MKIGIIIDSLSELYCWQWMGQGDHEYIIYRDQLHQYSTHTTLEHHKHIMKQGLNYLLSQGVDAIICPPLIELYYKSQFPQIIPIFDHYINHALEHSIVGKIGFIGSSDQCNLINLVWGNKVSSHTPTSRQVSNRHYQSQLPIWTSIDHHLTHRLTHHKPDHWMINHEIKSLLKPLKDAAIDTVIGLDRAYRACDQSFMHHSRHIRRYRSDVLKNIWEGQLSLSHKSHQYSVTIHHTGTLRDLTSNKQLSWLLSKGTTSPFITKLLDESN